MSIAISVITTANRKRDFTQQDENLSLEIFRNLGSCGQLFSSRVLIFGSSNETEIFNPSSITRIEVVTGQDITEYIPKLLMAGRLTFTALSADVMDNSPEPTINDNQVAGRVDFFFEGGDMLSVWMEGAAGSDQTERYMMLNKVFEQSVIVYKLPQGGIGLMNPAVMTRAVIKAGAPSLPQGAWRVEQA